MHPHLSIFTVIPVQFERVKTGTVFPFRRPDGTAIAPPKPLRFFQPEASPYLHKCPVPRIYCIRK